MAARAARPLPVAGHRQLGVPVPDAAPEPVPPKGKPVPAPNPAPRGPAVPKTPEDDLFDYCELLYAKTNYGLALQQYEQYLNLHPAGKHREEAIFKMGECRYLAEAWEQARAETWDTSWTKKVTGKHKAMFDVPEIRDVEREGIGDQIRELPRIETGGR